jgi:deferrochelatase/peroxidase EfeB
MRVTDEDYRDIQGLVRFGYKHLASARFYVLTFNDLTAAGAWLAAAPVTTAVKGKRPGAALNVAFTYEGLQRLCDREDILVQFPYEFKSGMSEPSRARRLGDVDDNAPQGWYWGGPGKVPDVLVMFYATTPPGLDEWEQQLMNESWHAGFSTLALLTTTDGGDIEPFGFLDGISQPVLDWEGSKPTGHYTTAYTNVAALGEVLLGYKNEYGKYTDRPLVAPADDPAGVLPEAHDAPGKKDLGRNGTYLVFRDLAQKAPAFWEFVNGEAERVREDRNSFAASTVGRVPSEIPIMSSGPTAGASDQPPRTPGDPIVALEKEAIPGVGPDSDDIRQNQFTFAGDVDGTACPFGAHIRRANPRNADLPQGTRGAFQKLIRILGFGRKSSHDDLIASTRFHRILRRGREYAFEATDGARIVHRGLRFMCLNGNISRQFEFIQASWLVNPKFEGLDEQDPLVGNRATLSGDRSTASFTRPRTSGVCVRASELKQFVYVRGGAYFFLPGISALRYLVRESRRRGKSS